MPLTPIQNKQIEASLCKEKLVSGVHDLLSAEVPYMQTHILFIIQLDAPLGDIYALCLLFPAVKFIANQAIHKRSLADIPPPLQVLALPHLTVSSLL